MKLKDPRQLVLPRWAVPLVWIGPVTLIHLLLPWALASLGPHFGWSEAAPGKWNFIGLIPIALGITLYIWCLVHHYLTYPPSLRISPSPPHLVVAGPYKFSRNPMYLAGLCTWLGWTIFFGSLVVLIALVLLWSAFNFRVIPLEERQLQGLFGDKYLEYMRAVPRWIGRL